MKKSKGKSKNWIAYGIPGVSFLTLLLLNVFCHDHWLDSDMAAEMMFSKLLKEGGHIFATPDWYYSTEFRFLYTHWIMGPLFWVFKDWHVIRMITNLLSYVLMLWSYYYFCGPLKVKKGYMAASSAILLLPFSETMMTHMVMGNTYMFHVIIVFWFFGIFLRLCEGNRRKPVLFVLYAVLGVICGVSGVRYLLALLCPLFLTALVIIVKSEEFDTFRKHVTGANWVQEGRTFLKAPSMRYLLYSFWGLLFSVVGYGINVFYVGRNYVFQTYEATNFIAVYQGVFWERVQNALGSLLMLFGYIPDRGVLSLRGVVTMLAFVLIALFVWVWVRTNRMLGGVSRTVAGTSAEAAVPAIAAESMRSFVTMFLAVSFCLNVFVFVFTTSTMVPRYYLTIFIFVLPVLCFYLEQEELWLYRTLVAAVLSLSLCVASAKTILSFVTVDKNETKRPVAEFLVENDYSFGCATYWNANIITELTDGRVEVCNILDPDSLAYFKWSSPTKYYEEGYAKDKVFLLLSAEEAAEYAGAHALQEGAPVYEDGAYSIFEFESMDALLNCAGR